MQNQKQLSALGLSLVFSTVLGIAAYCMMRPTLAHELYPMIPPVASACYVAATTCETTVENAADVDFTGRQRTAALTETVTVQPQLDGKSWLPQPAELVSVGAVRAANRKALFNITCTAGFADAFPCAGVDLLAFLPHTQIGGDTNNDMWGWTDPQTGKEYALVGARDGVAFVDISTPTAPRYLGKLPTHATRSTWRDLKVYKDHLFVVADKNNRHGMQVFDLAQLRIMTTSAGVTSTLLFSETAHYNEFSDAHNLAINEETGYAYAVGGETCNQGLHIINIQDVNHPQNAGCYTADGYIHDTQCVIYRGPDVKYQGRELCFNSSVSQFTILDVTDKTALTRVATIAVDGNTYMHQGWLTPDQHYFLLDDEMDEWFGRHNTRTYLFDVSTIDAPRFVNAYTAASPAVDHNLYISGTYVYEANYTSGLRILDLKNVAQGQLTEAGFFDTYPENDEAVTAGAWTAYPFYKSGVVAISTLDRGLFLVKPRLPADVLFTERDAAINLCTQLATQQQFHMTFDLLARNQYTQSVFLRTQQLPATATASFTPAAVDMGATAAATSTLTVENTVLTSGTYTFTVEAVNAEEQVLDTTSVHVYLASTLATKPRLQAPQDIRLTTLAPLQFVWSAESDVTSYTVEIATDSSFSTLVYTATAPSATLLLGPPPGVAGWTTPLAYGQQYYWRVQASNGCGDSNVSDVAQFRTPIGLFLPLIRR